MRNSYQSVISKGFLFRENIESARKKNAWFSIIISVTAILSRWAAHSRETPVMFSSGDINAQKAEKYQYVKCARTSILSTIG